MALTRLLQGEKPRRLVRNTLVNFQLRLVQDAWYLYLGKLGIAGTRTGEQNSPDYVSSNEIPFDHPDVRSYIDSMILD